MATVLKRDMRRGYGNKERPVIGELWQRDSTAITDVMTAEGTYQPSNKNIEFSRYYDPEFFKQEIEKVWRRQWLIAGREEDIPNVGDRFPLSVGPDAYMIVRTGAHEFKAYFNSCLHRGATLCAKPESGTSIRCPYHGWEWDIDGSLKKIPSHWDFQELNRLNAALPQVKIDRWGGFLFINADPESPPLAESLGVMPAHFESFGLERRFTKTRFRKLVGANWKASQEAFLESYHLYATHPEGVPFNGDSQSQYDIFPTPNGAIGREAVPSAVPSMHADASATPAAAAMAFAHVAKTWHYPDAELPEIDPSADVRAQIGAWARRAYATTYGRENTQPDAILLDSLLYFMYPQFCMWMSEAVPFAYQFLPHESDSNLSYFDVRLLMPFAEGEIAPPAAQIIEIGLNESIAEKAPLFSFLGMIFDQDMSNMPLIQRGMKAANPKAPFSNVGTYQEALMQHWHELIDRDIAR
ncbi:MAG: Rieske (2Fe-2S) protein [Sphingomonadales bacterium]|nr:Rieske (2Fe-2S) protein [Sphingomonadales bacterium]